MPAKYRNQFRLFTIATLLGSLRKHGGRAVGLEITLDDEPRTQRFECWPTAEFA